MSDLFVKYSDNPAAAEARRLIEDHLPERYSEGDIRFLDEKLYEAIKWRLGLSTMPEFCNLTYNGPCGKIFLKKRVKHG